MPASNFSETFESSWLMERYGQPVGNAVAGFLLLGGAANCIDEYLDVQRAKDSSVCYIAESPQCHELVAVEEEDAIKSSIGGLVGVTILAGLVFVVSRRENE